ncbi:MAG: M24 family metallopeptidase [Bacillota bacterium]
MADLGLGSIGVDWETRIDYERMRKERLAKAVRAVDESEADVVFLFRLENVRYVTGLRTHDWPMAHWGMACVILPRGGDYTLYTLDYVHALHRMPWLGHHLTEVPCRGLELRAGALAWAKDAKKRIEKLGIVPNVIGVDAWSPALYEVLPEVFPHSKFVDGQEIILKARMIKTQDEIMCLKMAYAITVAGMQAGLEYLRPGVKECEVLAECFRAMYRYGSEWSQCANIVCSGPYTAPYRRFTSDRIIEYGDPVIIDIGGRFNGYWGDFTRTWICGKGAKPSKELIKVHEKAYKALRAVEAAIKPGNTTRDVALAAGEYILGKSLGHGIGISGNEPPLIGTYEGVFEPENAVTLQPGMVFSIEPYAGEIGVGGVRLEDNFVVTETGCEVISKFPFEERLLG